MSSSRRVALRVLVCLLLPLPIHPASQLQTADSSSHSALVDYRTQQFNLPSRQIAAVLSWLAASSTGPARKIGDALGRRPAASFHRSPPQSSDNASYVPQVSNEGSQLLKTALTSLLLALPQARYCRLARGASSPGSSERRVVAARTAQAWLRCSKHLVTLSEMGMLVMLRGKVKCCLPCIEARVRMGLPRRSVGSGDGVGYRSLRT